MSAAETDAQLSQLKHRWNFASLDCAAVVHRTNPEAKFASSILSEKKDRYMLSPCPHSRGTMKRTSQFVIVELCDAIKMDTLVLANYEFFSSMFKRFTVTVAQRLTGSHDDWKRLGSFRARNVRGQQVFRIPRADAFVRYVRIDFHEHFGSEFYCPVSLLRVYGITEFEEYKQEVEARNEQDHYIAQDGQFKHASSLDQPHGVSTTQHAFGRDVGYSLETSEVRAKDEEVWRKHEQAFQQKLHNQSVTHEVVESETLDAPPSTQVPPQPHRAQPTQSVQTQSTPTTSTSEYVDATQCWIHSHASTHNQNVDKCFRSPSELSGFYHVQFGLHQPNRIQHQAFAASVGSAVNMHTSVPDVHIHPQPPRRTTMPPSNAMPPTQHGATRSESVYRAIHRRLTALESNATLSHSYIEHSGQMLREVFARMEKRHQNRMSSMLGALNATNSQHIETLKRRQHVELQRAMFEFDVHRQHAENERIALVRQVHMLGEEVVLEKRLSIAQLVMLLVVFVFVALTRGSSTVPLLHSGLATLARSSNKRDADTHPKLGSPTSPTTRVDRIEHSFDIQPLQTCPLRESMPSQIRAHPRYESANSVDVNTKRLRPFSQLDSTPTKLAPSAFTCAISEMRPPPSVFASVNATRSTKVCVAGLAGRIGSRRDSLIGMLSHPRTRARLIMLLDTLDALDRGAHRRGLSKRSNPRPLGRGPTQSADQHTSLAQTCHTQRDATVSASLHASRRASRALRPMITYNHESAHADAAPYAMVRSQPKVAHSRLDDMAGMSSDWTERSENGEVSENPVLSEHDDTHIPHTSCDVLSVQPTHNLAQQSGRRSSSDSDSESDGGAWHRVLPRRIGNTSSLRRPTRRTIDAKPHKVEARLNTNTRLEPHHRRTSPRPSSVAGSGFKSHKVGLGRLFRANTPEIGSPESLQSGRSGTPDTIRDGNRA